VFLRNLSARLSSNILTKIASTTHEMVRDPTMMFGWYMGLVGVIRLDVHAGRSDARGRPYILGWEWVDV